MNEIQTKDRERGENHRGEEIRAQRVEQGFAVLTPACEILHTNQQMADWLGLVPTELTRLGMGQLLAKTFGNPGEASFSRMVKSDQDLVQDRWVCCDRGVTRAGSFHAQMRVFPECRLFWLSRDPRDVKVPAALERGLLPTIELPGLEHFSSLITAEQQLDRLMGHWPGIVFSLRPDGSFCYISCKVEALTGIPAGEWTRETGLFWEVLHPADVARVKECATRASDSATPTCCRFRLRHALTGETVHIQEHRAAFHTSEGMLGGYEGIWLDATEKAAWEAQMQAADWQETVSHLTRGLAHDFRNVVTSALMFAGMVEGHLEGKALRSSLDSLRERMQQSVRLIERVLELHHGKSSGKTFLDLNEIAGQVLLLTRSLLSNREMVQPLFSSDRLVTYADPFEVQQALCTLLVVAHELVPRTCRLLLETARHDTPPEVNLLTEMMPKLPVLRLSLFDAEQDGTRSALAGFLALREEMDQIGERDASKVQMVHKLLQTHNGALSVDEDPGGGMRLSLWLPEADLSERRSDKIG